MQLKPHQQEGFDIAIKYLTKNKCFRLNTVTGYGKTVVAIKIADKICPNGTKIIAVHTKILRDQFEKEIAQFANSKKEWKVLTYQTLRTLKIQCDFLIVDEVHQGGQTADGSYRTIINHLKPKNILSLSATDHKVDERLFGKGKYCYGLDKASKNNVINNCNIITIDTGLMQQLSNKDRITAKTLTELYEKNEELDVDLTHETSVRSIINTSIEEALKVYILKEKGNQAVLFVPTIKSCIEAEKTAKKLGITVRCTHSAMRRKHCDKNIKDFKNKKFDLLICIRQLQEGFNYPALEVAIDCAPSFSNDGRYFKQRIGRILRINNNKKESRYYIINRINNFSSDLDIHDSLMANIALAVKKDLSSNGPSNREIILPESETDGNTKTYSLFIEYTKEYAIQSSRNLFNLLKDKDDSQSKKEMLLEMAKKGLAKPHFKTKFGKVFKHYTNSFSECYDEQFKNQLKELAPQWLQSIHEITQIKLLKMAKEGKNRPKSKTKEYSCLYKSLKKDKDFKKALLKINPSWTLSRVEKGEKMKTKLLEMAKQGKNRPLRKTKLANFLTIHTSKNCGKRYKQFKNQLKKLAPQWFKRVCEVRKKQLLTLAKKGNPKPKHNTKLGWNFSSYINISNRCYDAVFVEQIKKLRPDWLKRAKYIKTNKRKD